MPSLVLPYCDMASHDVLLWYLAQKEKKEMRKQLARTPYQINILLPRRTSIAKCTCT